MVAECDAIHAASGGETACWVYRNGVKALPWHASVRRLLEDRAQWGLFMPVAGCMPSPGVYVCGANASDNLYHDFRETPQARTFRCGVGIECGEYVFNHRNASLRDFFLGDYFFPSPFPKSVTGCEAARSDPGRQRGAHAARALRYALARGPRVTARTLTPSAPRLRLR